MSNRDDRDRKAPAAAEPDLQRRPWEAPKLQRLPLSRSEHTAGAGADGGGVEMTPS